MDGRCATCRHWRFEPWRYEPVGPTPLKHAMEPCDRMGHNGDSPDHDDSLAWSFVGGEESVVFTKANFGCVMWEAKPPREEG
jgi:hypothetical protein